MNRPSSALPCDLVQRWPRGAASPLLTIAQTRAVEQAALQGISDEASPLMRRAGLSLARLALALAPHAPLVRVECGPGHNGGDGLIAATALARWGRRVEVLPAFDPADLKRLPPAVARAWTEALQSGCLHVSSDGDDGQETTIGRPAADAILIDALLGIGARLPPTGRLLRGVRRLNEHPGLVLAVDVPTGLCADTGAVAGEAVQASHTLSFIAGKPGLFTGAGRDHAGQVWVDPLGLADAVADLLADGSAAGGATAVLGALNTPQPARPHASHKGSQGDVIVVGGAIGMEGAAELASAAALAAGAGRVWCASLASEPGAATGPGTPRRPLARLELMVLAPDRLTEAAVTAGRTVVAGCGGGQDIRPLLDPLIEHAARLVLDADALNVLAGDPALQRAWLERSSRGLPAVITPHPLEAARLLGCSVAAVQQDRPAAARALASRFSSVAVLKGSGTLVALPGGRIVVNPTGGPALATAGTGDVLAGWLGGLWAGLSGHGRDPLDLAFDAACETCRLHGAVAQVVTVGPLRAADLIERMWEARAGVVQTGPRGRSGSCGADAG